MKTRHSKRSGQAILFLIMVMLIGTFVVLWNFDLHQAVVLKMRVRDAGDGAALAAARWQAISLNTIGELNLIQAAVLTEHLGRGEWLEEFVDILVGIDDLRERVRISGPVVGYAAAQQVAFNNRIRNNATYQNELDREIPPYREAESADAIRNNEYIDYLESIRKNGVAAKTLTTHEYHILLDRDFYDAIDAGRLENWWCYFIWYPEFRSALESYTAPDYWSALPPLGGFSILDLGVHRSWSSIYYIADFRDNATKEGEFEDYIADSAPDKDIDTGLIQHIGGIYANDTSANSSVSWAVYGSTWRNSWKDFIAERNLPFRGTVRDEYDYMGPEAIFALQINYPQLSPGRPVRSLKQLSAGSRSTARGDQSMKWISAAKVFGYLEDVGGSTKPPHYFGLVLPAFHEVRLIPVQRDVSNMELDYYHAYIHLPRYLRDGIGALDAGCPFCQSLLWFDDPNFRQRGLDWISDPSHVQYCELIGASEGGGGGGGGGGGAPFGH